MVDSPCLTDEVLTALVEARLSSQELTLLHDHVAGCSVCHALLVAVVRGGVAPNQTGASPPPLAASAASPAGSPGTSETGWHPPLQFEKFRLLRPLGRGAMGVVHLAHDTSLDRQVAVKFIAARRPNVRAREHFRTEARAIARLKHPNVLTVFDDGEVEGHPYLVSEYLEGTSLAERALPLPWRQVLHLGMGLASGLAAAHKAGVLHRDIKPSNILLTTSGEVKLLDFGLAELVGMGEALPPSSGRTIAGTPRYMAPEVIRGAPATPRSDLYSLGLVLYELCTGELPPRPPAQEGRGDTTAPEGVGAEGTVLPQHVPGIDVDFAALIGRCLQANPDERVTSADALHTALKRLETPPHEPQGAGNPYRGLAPFEARHGPLFFGRDEDIRRVLERLSSQTLVLVAGDSGVGKSSLCRAGILPRVERDGLDTHHVFSTLTLEPGHRPLTALAAALVRERLLPYTEAELGALLASEPERVGRELRSACQETRGLLLFVDQLEELITLGDAQEAACFARLLGELSLPAGGVRVLLAVRGDFLTRLGALPGVGNLVESALYLLRPLPPSRVREAITGPARSRGVTFESEQLIHTLVETTAHGAGSLPLLQFTLAELWEHRDPLGHITQSALDAMGGVTGALSRHADAVLTRLSQAERRAARHLLCQLITPEGTRRERGEEELAATSVEARTALGALVEGRLLQARTVDKKSSYEIAHEVLIQSWPTLRAWLHEDTGQWALRQRLEMASVEWYRLDRPVVLLWRGRQLDEARDLMLDILGERERTFMVASRHAARRRRLAVGLIIALAMGAYGGLLIQAHLETRRFVEEQVITLRTDLALHHALGQRALADREQALALFDGSAHQSVFMLALPGDDDSWADAVRKYHAAMGGLVEARQKLKATLQRIYGDSTLTFFGGYPLNGTLIGDLDMLTSVDATWVGARQKHEAAWVPHGTLISDPSTLTSADDIWVGARQKYEAAMIGFAEVKQKLEAALQRVPGDPELNQLREDLDRKEVLLSERFLEKEPTRRPSAVKGLDPSSELELTTSPPDARIEVMQYVDNDVGERRPEALSYLDPALSAPTSLQPGSYLLRITHEGYAPMKLPLLMRRAQHGIFTVQLPEHVPEGFVYIPPGCTLVGTTAAEEVRSILSSAPAHTRCLQEGFLIGRTEVTLGEWMAYVDTLAPEAPERELLASPPPGPNGIKLSLKKRADGWRFSLQMDGVDGMEGVNVHEAREGERIHYPRRSNHADPDWRRLPLVGVSANDLTRYFKWRNRSPTYAAFAS